jgi:YesN/AraC family two-component response regulator
MDIGVLIVDDEDDIRYLMRTIINDADEGLKVIGEARDGAEAIDHVNEMDPVVVVLDERMPGLTGIETALGIARKRPQQRMILCSAYIDDELVRRAEGAGIKVCLTKEQVAEIPQALCELARAVA